MYIYQKEEVQEDGHNRTINKKGMGMHTSRTIKYEQGDEHEDKQNK